MSEHEQTHQDEEAQDREELRDLDVRDEDAEDVKGGGEPINERPQR